MDILFYIIVFAIFVGIVDVASPELSWKMEKFQNKLLGIGSTTRPEAWDSISAIRGSLLSVLAILALYAYYNRIY